MIKWSATDRQIVLVNMARALKYLEDLGQRQSHLQQTINVQQTYTATLCTYINNILPHITKLEETILQLEQKIIMEQDTIQINAPDFDLDIDGPNPPRTHNNTVVVSVQQHSTSPEPEVSDATNFQEEGTDRDPPDATYNNFEESHGYDNFPQDIQDHTIEQSQITLGYSINPGEIPELEEDWDNGQFADANTNLIDRHNTHSESERIRREYTQHLLDLSDNQYYCEENPINQLQYSSTGPDYYGTPMRWLQKTPCNPNGY